MIFLENHGLIAASNNIETTNEIIVNVERQLRPKKFIMIQRGKQAGNWVEVFPPGTLNSRNTKVLVNGALTPDQIVFLGPVPFVFWNEINEDSKVAIKSDGSVWAINNLGQDALEIIESFINIVEATDKNSDINYLSKAAVFELLNWDAEKWRLSQTK